MMPSGLPVLLLGAGMAVVALTGSGFLIQITSQVLVLWTFGLSYQLLFGRSGMLSFGHAVNFGLAAFATAHAVRSGAFPWLPYECLPAIGALAGLACGFLLGYPVSRRSGIAFAMVTLGIGELVAACFLMFPDFFGGEAGLTMKRTEVPSAFGIDYGRAGTQLALTTVWTLLVLGAVAWLTRTPFGLATLAVRENPVRIEYLCFRTATIRWVSTIVSSTLAGIAGALSALTYEIVTVDAVSLHTSANVLLLTVIGGMHSLYGPLLGAIFLVTMQSVVSEWTRAWLFYYGFVFVVLVLAAPEGITGLWSSARATASPRAWRGVVFAFAFACGLVVFVETSYQLALGEAARLPGWKSLDAATLRTIVTLTGAGLLVAVARWLRQREPAA